MTIEVDYAGQNWMINPAISAVNEPPPSSISDQKWMMVLTGVAILNETLPDGTFIEGIRSNNPHDWRRLDVFIRPPGDASVSGLTSTLHMVVNRYGIPIERGEPIFSLDWFGWAPFVTVSSFLDPSQPTAGAGVAVDHWRPRPFGATDANNVPIPNAYRGVFVDVAVFGQSVLHRISYNITLVGKIVFGFYPRD
jgi:hypothetical protein